MEEGSYVKTLDLTQYESQFTTRLRDSKVNWSAERRAQGEQHWRKCTHMALAPNH